MNADIEVLKDFGEEWGHFDQSELSDIERKRIFEAYFSIFPWQTLEGGHGADIGCGSGRWALLAANRVGRLELVDGSEQALGVARRNLKGLSNVGFHLASVGKLPFESNSLDFVYSLGVLHHVPDTQAAINEVARVLKPGAPLLTYLYYRFDNRHPLFAFVWRLSDLMRRLICRLPFRAKVGVCELLAAVVYYPFARTGLLLEKIGLKIEHWPLYHYRHRSFYVMRTDALDRFGTKLEQRFTRVEIKEMLESAGLSKVEFSNEAPYWCSIAYKRQATA